VNGPIPPPTAEELRLADARSGAADWRRWGPYLSERQWGTVREDYSADGTAWEFFPHDHARSRAYRWGEDGIAGISDDKQTLCFAIALWNGRDAILKERLFGLTGNEGNHGEDVKEYAFYVDNVPSHAYMTYLYKYPQRAFPYADLVETNGRRGKHDFEYELHSRSSIPISPNVSSCSSPTSAISATPARSRPMNGASATSTRRCTRGPRCGCTRSSARCTAGSTGRFSKRCFTIC
jgi:hypothetical protein